MKAILVAFSMLAVFSFAVAPSYALVGVDDNVVGCDVLVPFFLVSMPGHGNVNTVLYITETWLISVTFNYFVHEKNSTIVYNDSFHLTPGDVGSLDVLSVLNRMAPSIRARLEIDLNGDGTNDHWAGYLVFENGNSPPLNQVMAMAYIMDLPNGITSTINLPVREAAMGITDGKLVDSARHTEYFSANALARAHQYIGLQGTAGTVSDARNFRLLPRYSLMSSNSNSYWFIWTSSDCPSLHVYFWNNEEKQVSSSFPRLQKGLNIISIGDLLPVALHSLYPKEGWVMIFMPDLDGAGFDGDREMLGYSFSFKAVPTGLCGDVNNNGEVDVADAMYIAQFLAGNRDCICKGTAMEWCGTGSKPTPGINSLTKMHKDVW